MNALEFAHAKISFDESSPITGRFDISKYRMLMKPLLALSDIQIKRMVCYKASSALGTVFLQIALAYRLDQCTGNCYFIGSTRDDAETFVKTRGKKWIARIPSLASSMSNDKHAVTNSLFQWPDKWLEIQGPGENAQQGRQCTYLFTDETHVEEWKEGAISAFEERMSKRWNRFGLHATTAANSGKEVDRFYYMGGQNEFHVRCPSCNSLVWPLWEEDAKREYNGEKVFHFGSGFDSVTFVCPHCSKAYEDDSRSRYALHEHSDYVTKNPDHASENESYRWGCFAAWWTPWQEQLSKYREAIEAAKLGNLEPHENFVKKRLCQSYVAEMPDTGEGSGASDYKIGSVWITEHPKLRTASFDVQDENGFHLWGQVDEFNKPGESRRVDYQRIASWADARAFQLHHGASDKDTYCDAGHRTREVFGMCAAFHWYALLSTDQTEFAHFIEDPRTHARRQVGKPFSAPEIEDPMSGRGQQVVHFRQRPNGSIIIPKGFCGSFRWSKYAIGSYLMKLKSGESRYYGVASDILPEYTAQLHSYAFVNDINKKTGARTLILKQIKTDDHAFATSSQCLLGAIIAGYFPLSTIETKTENAA